MSPYREPTLTPPRMRWVLTRSLWPELATAMLVLAVSIRVWLLAPTFFGACWVALVAAMVVLAAPRFVARVPVENGTPWRRSVVSAVCPWWGAARRWAGGRWTRFAWTFDVNGRKTGGVEFVNHFRRDVRWRPMERVGCLHGGINCTCEVYP